MVRPRQISDHEIVRAARDTFIRLGPATAVNEIAERLGVSAAALFQRAGSKAQLMLMALSPGQPPALQNLAAPPSPERPIVAQLQGHLTELMTFFQSVIPALIVLRAAGLFPGQRRGRGKGRGEAPPAPVALRGLLARWLAEGAAQGRIQVKDPQACAEALLGAMEARCFNAHVGGADYVIGSDAEFLAALIAGLLTDLESHAAHRRR